MTTSDDDAKFATLIDALRPALGQIVVVGGWACRLYRLCPNALPPGHDPLFTTDADVAFASRGLRGIDLRTRLKERGFGEDFSGEDSPPVTHYTLGADNYGFYAEFLTPLIGGELKRDGTPDLTVRVGNVIAQKLRYLEILLVAPWSVNIQDSTGFPVAEPATIQIPNPVSYIVQKLLINSRRHPGDQAKDLLYIHDTIELFGGSLDALAKVWRDDVARYLHKNHRRQAVADAERLFGRVNDENRAAAALAADRTKPALLQSLAFQGLRVILE